MDKLEEKLGYTFIRKELLTTALTHSSWANENKISGRACNERFEFLGDAVLGFVVASHLFENDPDMPEGQMTRKRAELVCERSLMDASDALELGLYLKLGRGEELGGGRKRPSILADAFEAVVAAVFLDGGIAHAKRVVDQFILSGPGKGSQPGCDYKTMLQEVVQRKSGRALSYHLVGESGPDHMKHFDVEVRVDGEARGAGMGRSKKEAEQAAAKVALEAMKES